MSQQTETFFTVIGCMDGRCQDAVARFGRERFDAQYPDTITEPGMVGVLASGSKKEFLDHLRKEIEISLTKHNSKGIIVDGHAECAADPVDGESHRDHVRKAVEIIRSFVDTSVTPVIGVFVKRQESHPSTWEVEQLDFLFKNS